MLADDFLADNDHFLAKFKDKSDAELRALKAAAERQGIPDVMDSLSGMVGQYKMFSRVMGLAQRFVLSPMVVDAADEFADSQKVVKSALDFIFLPAETTWIEWHAGRSGDQTRGRHGLLLIGRGEGHAVLSVGEGAYVTDRPGRPKGDTESDPIVFDLHDYVFKPRRSILQPGDRERIERLGRFLVCALALINTPRLSQVVHHDIAPKLNAARAKRGKPPLLSWNDVTIRPDVGWMPNKTHELGATGEKRRHHVRTFMRLKRGKVEIVKPHWRGNAERGYVLHRHVVRMDGEEAGAWKGEPLPGPQIIKPDTTIPEE
jgi:hypothetical protein